MHSYIPMNTVQYRKDSLSGIKDVREQKQYSSIIPNNKSSYNRKKEFLESCNSSSYLNSPGNINSITKVINSILEFGTESQKLETISFINYDIIPKLQKFSPFINSLNKNLLSEEYILSINESVNMYNLCDRVLSNDNKLSKRFNFNKYIRENVNRDPRDLVFSLCEMIDTYNIPLRAKYNVALENIQYSLYNTHLDKSNIVKDITDYFLLRESLISDEDYKNYKYTVSNNQFIDPEQLFDLRIIRGRRGTNIARYADKMEYIKNNNVDSEISRNLLDILINISTEEQANDYIKTIDDTIFRDTTLSNNDKNVLENTINMIPLISGVDKDFIDYQVNKLNIPTKTLSETVDYFDNIIKDRNDIFGKYYSPNNTMSSFDIIGCANIHDYIEEFKVNLDKSPKRFITMLANIVPNSTEMASIIIDELPEIFDIMRLTYVLPRTVQYIDSVLYEFINFISRILENYINPEDYYKLNKLLDREYNRALHIMQATNNFKDESLTQYANILKKATNLVSQYTDSLAVREEANLSFDDVELSFEESVSLIETLVQGLDDINKLNKESLLSSITDNIRLFTTDSDNLRNLSTICIASNVVNKQEYGDLLRSTCCKYDDAREKIIIASELASLDSIKFDTDDISRTIIMIEACNILKEYFIDDNINEASLDKKKKGVSLNDLQLAMKAFGAKIKDLSSKEKILWKNVDMYGSNIIKSIQKALTSDRREAIIKGSIIPSLSKCIKSIIAIAGTSAVGAFFGAPYIGIITAIGMFAASKKLNNRERQLIYDEIDTELKVVEKEISMAESDGDMKKYRFLLTYQKKLYREKARIKYGARLKGMAIPSGPNPPSQRS